MASRSTFVSGHAQQIFLFAVFGGAGASSSFALLKGHTISRLHSGRSKSFYRHYNSVE